MYYLRKLIKQNHRFDVKLIMKNNQNELSVQYLNKKQLKIFQN